MKPTQIVLPPHVEPFVKRLAIGAGQPEYQVIPAIQIDTPTGGLVAYLSRWELTSNEKNAVARSELRGMLIAFATWLHNQMARDPALAAQISEPTDGDIAIGAAVHRFISAHASQLEGEDAALWYTRLLPPGDGYQPQQLVIDTEIPIHVEEVPDRVPTLPPSSLVH